LIGVGDAVEKVESVPLRIVTIRGERVMLSFDLAALYGVEAKTLIQAVKRNAERFPADFLFQVTREEWVSLKSQFVTSSWGGLRRAMPYAFTEHGVAMLSSVLRSSRAVQVNIEIMRAFVRIREMAMNHGDLARRLDALEAKYDGQFRVVFDAMRQLMAPPAVERPRIGFRAPSR
jgi:hypothetical protein